MWKCSRSEIVEDTDRYVSYCRPPKQNLPELDLLILTLWLRTRKNDERRQKGIERKHGRIQLSKLAEEAKTTVAGVAKVVEEVGRKRTEGSRDTNMWATDGKGEKGSQ